MTRTLVAGIGNVFLGDDAFGVEVVARLVRRPHGEGVQIRDFGIRGLDLAYALLDGWEQAILIDAVQRGGAPGTLYVIEPEITDAAPVFEGHALVPAQVLAMVQALGGSLPPIRIVGCEPGRLPAEDDLEVGLSPEVSAAIEPAIELVERLLEARHA